MMQRILSSIILIASLFVPSSGQGKELLERAFETAAAEFNVPPDILKAIAFAETRWFHLTWSENDTASCTGMPHPYGIMALWKSDQFGGTLYRAAERIGIAPEVVAEDLQQNMRGAAALLRAEFDKGAGKRPEPLNAAEPDAWMDAIAAHSGIQQPELSYSHAFEVLYRLTKGYEDETIRVPKREVRMDRVLSRLKEVEQTEHSDPLKSADVQVPDYPPARWIPGVPGYYYSSGNGKKFVVIHDMEGYYASVLSYFQSLSDGRKVSIHYCVNGLQDSPSDYPPGDIAQMVEEQYYAWHAVCLNTWSLGIEHEGFAGNPAWFTPEMYIASAGLVRHMVDKFSIPADRNHIVGHGEYLNPSWAQWVTANGYPSNFLTCNSHYDPGSFWDWDFFMQLIRDDRSPPEVESIPPTDPIQVDSRISVTFSQRMEPVATAAAFTISPPISANLSWGDIGRTLRVQPASHLPFDSEFTVTIDSSARNYLGVGLDLDGDGVGGDPYSFTVRTVLLDSIPPSITGIYPRDNETGVSSTADFVVTFTESLDESTLQGGFGLETASGVPFQVTGLTYVREPDRSVVRFKTVSELFPSTDFRVIVHPTIKDLSGNPLAQGRTVAFTTGPTVLTTGLVVNSLDASGGWWQPSTSGSTRNVLASFSIATDVKHSGSGSGKVEYTWTQASGGILREHNSSTPGVEGAPTLGAWVRGDNSGHDLRFACYSQNTSGGTSFVVVSAGPVNWTGWKLKTIPMSSIPTGNGQPRRFSSFMLYQTPGGAQSGTIYFDELSLITGITGVDGLTAEGVPHDWALHQNYPNPFNPSTTIVYDVPVAGRVRLTVWNALGQLVGSLLDEEKGTGRYRESFDASALPSGLYFARLQGGNSVRTLKMMLLR